MGTANNMVSKIILIFISSCTAQLKFGGSTGSSDNTNTASKQPETDTRFFTGNQALDGGIVGLGAGLLGGAVLSGALSGEVTMDVGEEEDKLREQIQSS